MLAMVGAGPLTSSQQATVDLILGQLAFLTSRGGDAPSLLLKAARSLEPIDTGLSRATYLDALAAGMFAGRLASPGSGVMEIARATAAAPPPLAPRAPDFLLDGLAAEYNDGYAAGTPMLRRALATFGDGMSAEEELRWLWLASVAAMRVWDDDGWEALSARHVGLARRAGALSELPLALTSRSCMLLFAGDLTAAASLTDEAQAIKEATGTNLAPYGALSLAALRGDEAGTLALLDATKKDVTRRGEGSGITFAEWANAVLNNGLGRYPDALAAARRATSYEADLGSLIWPTVELIEAAARSRATETATGACERFAVMTGASGTDWALGLQTRSQALLREGRPRSACTARRSPAWAGPGCASTSPALTCCTGNGAPPAPPLRRARAVAHRSRHAGGDGRGGVRGAGAPRAAGHWRDRPQAHRRDSQRADRPGSPDRPAGARRAIEPRDRHPAVHQRAHRPVPLAQGLRQARHHLA
jgi:hypothetical protein